MTDLTNDFTRPATKVACCMAVPRSLPGVYPSSVAVLAIAEFRKDFPELAARLESMRECARATRGPACGDTASAAGADFSALPDGNHGDNQTPTTDKAVL